MNVKISLKTMLIVGAFACITSCEKEDSNDNNICPDPTYPVAGLYVGTYTVDGMTQPPLAYSIVVFPNGSILTKGLLGTGSVSYATGTWSMSNNNFVADIETMAPPAIEQRITATFSDSGKLNNAIWQDIVNPFTLNRGNFQNMNRVN